MDKKTFMLGMKIHFNLNEKEAHSYTDKLLFLMGRGFTLDMTKFDDYLHEKFGEYEDERGLSMKELIAVEYSTAAANFVESMIGGD